MRPLTRSTLALALCLTACAKRPVAPAESTPPVEQVATPKKPITLRNVYFAFDSDTVSKLDQSRILRDCLRSQTPRVLTGSASNERGGKYTDKASKAYNLAISARRANSVALAYTVSGCHDNQVAYIGETDRYGKPHQNRRVVVQ